MSSALCHPRAPAEPRAVVETIAEELGLDGSLARFSGGSVPVFAVGNAHVVKLFPWQERAFLETEVAALSAAQGRLSIPTPRVVTTVQRMGWRCLVMTRVMGEPLVGRWRSLDADDRVRVVRSVGRAVAELHALPVIELGRFALDWPVFIEEQCKRCAERQRDRGLGSPWLEGIDDFLRRHPPRRDPPRVLLHTEIMREHVLATGHAGSWRPSGLVDFEPAMLGDPEYELASVGVFLTCAEPGLMAAFLDGYGKELDDELPLRALSFALLHRYSRLSWYLERLPFSGKAGDFHALAREWFGS